MTDMTQSDPQTEAPNDRELTGPARDFSAYAKLEFERRRNSQEDFDADLFRQAVSLALHKLEA